MILLAACQLRGADLPQPDGREHRRLDLGEAQGADGRKDFFGRPATFRAFTAAQAALAAWAACAYAEAQLKAWLKD